MLVTTPALGSRSARPLLRGALAGVLVAALWWLGAPAAAQERVVITRGECQRLVRHVPAADVAYAPGVDVRGKPVAPADIGGGYDYMQPPEEIAFDLRVDLRNFLGGPEADAQAASAALAAADKAATAASAAAAAATEAETASAANPANAALAAAAAAARIAADAATAAVAAGDKSAAAQSAATAATAAAAADPGNAPLATAAATAETAAAGAAAASAALNQEFADAARVGQFLGEPVVGRVAVRGHEVYYNGRRVDDDGEAALAAACAEALERQR